LKGEGGCSIVPCNGINPISQKESVEKIFGLDSVIVSKVLDEKRVGFDQFQSKFVVVLFSSKTFETITESSPKIFSTDSFWEIGLIPLQGTMLQPPSPFKPSETRLGTMACGYKDGEEHGQKGTYTHRGERQM
jgi:hypothetical protein